MKLKIKNRDNRNIVAILEKSGKDKGIAFIVHGLGGFKEQRHIKAFNSAFRQFGYATVRWDARDTIGESEGRMEDATLTSFYQDLEDVISWAQKQAWFKKPFVLCGHSLGSAACILYAQRNPNQVKALVPTSAVVSGRFLHKTFSKKELKDWQEKGHMLKESTSKPGLIKKIGWESMEDILEYDALEKVDRLTMPILLIVGHQDETTGLKSQKILFRAIPGNKKKLHIIQNAPHTFRNKKHLVQIKKIITEWLKEF